MASGRFCRWKRNASAQCYAADNPSAVLFGLSLVLDKVRANHSSLVRYEEEDGLSCALLIMTERSRLYSSAIDCLMACTMVETEALLSPNCSQQ